MKPSLAYTNTAGKSGLRSNKLNNASSTPSGVSLQIMPSCKLAIRCQCSPAGTRRSLTFTDRLSRVSSGVKRRLECSDPNYAPPSPLVSAISPESFQPQFQGVRLALFIRHILVIRRRRILLRVHRRDAADMQASACTAFCSCKAFHTWPWRNTSRLMPMLSTSRVSRRGEVFGRDKHQRTWRPPWPGCKR